MNRIIEDYRQTLAEVQEQTRMREGATCAVHGCMLCVKSKGFCDLHYKRFWRYGDPLFTKRDTPQKNHQALCQVDGCNREYTAKGYCKKHYAQWSRTGSHERRCRKAQSRIITHNTHACVSLTQGAYAMIDIADIPKVKPYNWRLSSQGYAVAWRKAGDMILMHRIIIEHIPDTLEVDHINRNKLDNRTCNLRVVTHSDNMANRTTTNKYGYIGITKLGSKYKAKICKHGKHMHIGMFATPEAAAMAYDKRAIELHGSCAMFNFPNSND